LNAGKTLEAVAQAAGLDVKEAWSLKRNAEAQGLSAAAINQVFATPVNGFATALSGNGDERVVLRVTESSIPPYDPASPTAKAVNQQLADLVQQDLVIQYVERLKDSLGVSINQANVNRAVGGGES